MQETFGDFFQYLVYQENRPLIFTQAVFWIFFGGVILVYQFIYRQNNIRNLFLMLFSMYFYYLSSGYYFVLLIFSTLVDYYLGNAIYNSEDQSKRKLYVTLSVIINLTVLGYFKYAYFFTDTFNTVFDTSLETNNILALSLNKLLGLGIDASRIFLPVGISFYTFQTISYSVDIYRRRLEPVKNIFDFAFFVSFFPQLVAGPIVRATDFIPQIYQKYHLSKEEFGRGTFLIISGLIKKIFISDFISVNYVDRIFGNPDGFTGFENLMAVYGYSLQIYCDFSGYTDIAIGIALILGYRLPLNFNSPYKSINITDFWRRWHISLSSWLRDYLYISLGGNRKGKGRTYINLMLTMLLGGLWHGAHLRFIVWGALHGIALAFHKMWMEIFKSKVSDEDESFVSKLISGIITFHFVAFCWIFFRADTFELAGKVISQIAQSFHPEVIYDILVAYKNVFMIMLFGYILHWLPSSWKNFGAEVFVKTPDFAKATIIFIVIMVLFQVKSSELQPFIYFQF
ncbi:MAG: membrane-bound O-acyltransferase family protein [Thalassobius sp.]|nr:membrane-bound O-acyltransferase family protein [Thalassovita sp.]